MNLHLVLELEGFYSGWKRLWADTLRTVAEGRGNLQEGLNLGSRGGQSRLRPPDPDREGSSEHTAFP